MSTSQQCALAAETANSLRGCVNSSVAGRSWEGIVPLYCSALMIPPVENCVQFWARNTNINNLE